MPETLDPNLRIFVSYRREDGSGYAGLLYETLSAEFGDANVFIDVDKLGLGLSFEEGIDEALATTDVLIAVIGRNWQNATDQRGRRRLDDPNDYVRREIESALERKLRVIPVLAEGTSMPASDDLPESLKDLSLRQALEMGMGRRWKFDSQILIEALQRAREQKVASIEASPEESGLKPAEERARATSLGSPSNAGKALSVIDDDPHASVASASQPRLRTRSLRRHFRPRWRTRIALLVGLLAVAAVTAAVVLTRGSSRALTPPEHSEPASGTMSDAIESELLLAHIPMEIRGSCKPSDNPQPDVYLRMVDCAQDASGASVTYGRAHAGEAMNADFEGRVKGQGISYPTSGGCGEQNKAADAWSREGSQTHVEGGGGDREGRVLCWVNSSNAWIVWTDRPTKILAAASRPIAQRAALYKWWRSVAGPENQLREMASMVPGPYPDAIEQELLLDHVPAAIEGTCHRTEVEEKLVFLRAIECVQVPGGEPVTYSLAHSASALNVDVENRMTAAGLLPPSRTQEFDRKDSCAVAKPTTGFWSGVNEIGHRESGAHGARGLVWCSPKDEKPSISWTDGTLNILAVASRDQDDWQGLYRWWQTLGGPSPMESQGEMN
jgi:hypothetical protein